MEVYIIVCNNGFKIKFGEMWAGVYLEWPFWIISSDDKVFVRYENTTFEFK